MYKSDLRKMLSQGRELNWFWEDAEYWMLPIWNKDDDTPFIEPEKVFLVVVENETRKVAKEFGSLDAIIAEGYDLEKMCDDSNPTFSY